VPAIPKFYQQQYPLPLPVFSTLIPEIREFSPHIVHVHHPLLMGSTGQVIAADRGIPLVYTHHTRYSVYIETKTDWPRPIEEGILELITGFCELCDGVIAPSQGIEKLLRQRGIGGHIEVIPTGVDIEQFTLGHRGRLRDELNLSPEAFVVGHVGRLAPEKNCDFLCDAVTEFLRQVPDAVFVVVGDGPQRERCEEKIRQAGASDRCHFLGFREGADLVDAYASFDVFAFASHSETQGMVLAEAMAAAVPVVAVQGTGVRDLLVDGRNGRLVARDSISEFVAALHSIRQSDGAQRDRLRQGALETARQNSQRECATKMLDLYAHLIRHSRTRANDWEHLQQKWDAGWQRWRNRVRAVVTATRHTFASTDS
jgi:glycosyltransferase involved in cell wall biosynthesis